MKIRRFNENIKHEERYWEEENEIDVPEWADRYEKLTNYGQKVIMYNWRTGDIRATVMKINNKKFEKTFSGYEPIGLLTGYQAGVQKFWK
jgi:hypothetical protein